MATPFPLPPSQLPPPSTSLYHFSVISQSTPPPLCPLSRIHYTALSGPPSREGGGRRSFERGRRVIENNCRLRKCVSNPSYSFDRTDKLRIRLFFSFFFSLSLSFSKMNFIQIFYYIVIFSSFENRMRMKKFSKFRIIIIIDGGDGY